MAESFSSDNSTPGFSPAWYGALHLSERTAGISGLLEDNPPLIDPNSKAWSRLTRWKKIPVFNKASFFEQRLSLENLTQAELLQLLAEPPQELKTRIPLPPDWLVRLAHDLSQTTPADPLLDDLIESLDPDVTSFANPYLRIIRPLVAPALQRLWQTLAKLTENRAQASGPFEVKSLVRLFLTNLSVQIPHLFLRTMALEVNLARLKGKLWGETPQERFESFIEQLTRPENRVKFFEEYCVLARLAQTLVDHWAGVSLEFAERLHADWPALCHTYFGDVSPGRLIEIEGGAGDSHRGGRSVLKLKFENGSKLIYKPHSLALDFHFQQLLGWFNEKIAGLEPELSAFRTINVLDRGNYGWCEFVETEVCSSEAEIKRFYRRQGAFLALLYTLEATDFHAENLLAAGENPVLVDLEALFHPRSANPTGDTFQNPAFTAYVHSVARTGLLPERIFASKENPGFDISGLGNRGGQMSASPAPFMEELGTDQMHVERKRFEIRGNHNQPTLNDTKIEALDYLEDVTGGFDRMYRLVMSVRAELLEGPLKLFRRDEIRFIARPTLVYDRMLRESYHPNYLRDALDRERIFDRLWLAMEWQPALARLFQAERADLWRGDIPYFSTFVNSRDLFDSQGQPIPGFLAESGFEAAEKRIASLDEEDLARQLWVIRSSFATIPPGPAEDYWKSSNISRQSGPKPNRRELLGLAGEAGNRLVKLAYQDGDYASWLGLQLIKEREWKVLPAGADLYAGTAGPALFLAYLGKISGEDIFTKTAQAALKTVQRQVRQLRQATEVRPVGGFGEYMSGVYLYLHLAALWKQPALLDEAEALLEDLPRHIEADRDFDVLDGTAGCLAVLLSFLQARPSSRLALETALRCGEHLLSHARSFESGQGVYWKTAIPALAPLVGFAHGTTGIGYNLLRLAALTGRPDFKQTALATLTYERQVFSPLHQDWPDFRATRYNFDNTETDDNWTPETEAFPSIPANFSPEFRATWCSGAPGIGLARAAALSLLDEPQMRQELEAALEATLKSGFGLNHSLCHGDLGSLELLLYVSQTQDTPGNRKKAELATQLGRVVSTIKTQGWICGTPFGVEEPGLMTGLAGIGYGLLRAASPEKIPSVLLLEAPSQ